MPRFFAFTCVVLFFWELNILTETPAHAAESAALSKSNPQLEIFVQTGHSGAVKFVAANQSNSRLATIEEGLAEFYLKIWDVATGREVRTVELGPSYSNIAENIFFTDDNTLIIVGEKSAERYDLEGQHQGSLHLPQQTGNGIKTISRSGQYLFVHTSGTKIYNVRDGSEIVLPEIKKFPSYERYQFDTCDLGFGYFGIFYKGATPKGNADYTIYDDQLNDRIKGSLNVPGISFGSRFKISPDLKLIAYQSPKTSANILVYELDSGRQLFSYTPRLLEKIKSLVPGLGDKESLFFDFLPDGRLRVEYVKPNDFDDLTRTARVELVLIDAIKNGIYAEKKLILDGMKYQSMALGYNRPYVITTKGELIAGLVDGSIEMTDINTGAKIRNFGIKPLVFGKANTIGQLILNWDEGGILRKKVYVRFNLWDLSLPGLKSFNVKTETALYEKQVKRYGSLWVSADPETLYGRIPVEFINQDFKKEDTYGRYPWGMIYLLKSNISAFKIKADQHKLTLEDKKGKLADLYAFENGEWIVITPEGYYNASANGDRYLNVHIGNHIYGIENYRETFFRPDLVKVALSGGSLQEFQNIADVKQPPSVDFIAPPKDVNSAEMTLKVRLTDNGGGIGDVRLYLNGSAVAMQSSRGIAVKPIQGNPSVRTFPLKLAHGKNTISVVAFNSDNSMQSNAALLEVTAYYAAASKPSLYALVVGINEFKNPNLTLNFPVADAELFAATLGQVSTGLFDKIQIHKMITREATTSQSIIKEIKTLYSLCPDDVFVFYIASHGTVDDGEYYLITSNVGSLRTEKLEKDAISQYTLKEAIANIPATKKLIIIDTCNAGALGKAIQSAMLTRGLSEDAALKILSRAMGSTILSASTAVQEALEGYNGHGLFTYVLVEGLKGKADKGGTGYIKTTELADYVDDQVPALAEKVFKRAQYPTISISGQAFPIGRIK